MSFLRRISRIISLKRVKSHKKREKSYQNFLQKIAIGSASLGFLAYTNLAFGSTITAHGSATTVTQESSDKYKVTTTQTSGGNAFNSFSEFNLSTGDNINLFLPTGTSNLINFVKSHIQIDGTLNAIKNNKIGGNLFFLSSQGIAVGSGGMINCGAFFAMTPTQDFMDKFVKDGPLPADRYIKTIGNSNEIGYITNRNFVNHNGIVSDKGIPLNNDASIVIAGQINAIDNVGLTSHEITISNGSLVKTGVTNFSGLVNTSDLPIGCQTNSLTMTSTADGNIEIVAIANNKDGTSAVSEKVANELTDYTKAEANAKVTVNGTINAQRNATIEAVAVNGELDSIDENFKEYGETKPQEKYTSAKFVSKINATVEFGTTANVNADRNLVVNAISRNFYSPSSINALDLGLSVLGMASPINIAAEVAVADSKAEVLVKSGATLHASEDVNITADSKAEISVGASTAIAKIKKTGGGLSAGVVYADVNSEANVIIEGSVTAGESGVTDKGNITVEAKSTNNMDITGATKTANDNAFFALGAVIANGSNNSKVEVKNTANVIAEKDISITANTESDVTTEAIAETGNASYFGVAVNVTDFESESIVKINSDLNANNGDIDVESNNLILQYRSVARSTSGYTVLGQALANAESNLVSGLFSKASFTSKFTNNLGSAAKNKFKAAGAILFNEGSNNSTINVGGNVKISAKKEVNIKASSIVEDYYLQSVSKAISQLDGAHSASAGIMSTDLEQNSTIQFEDSTRTGDVCNALVTGSKVNITTLNKIEYNRISRMIQAVKDAWEMLEGNVSAETWNGYIANLKTAWNDVDAEFSALGTEGLTVEGNIKTFMDAIGSIPAVPIEILDMVINGSNAVVRSAAKVVSNASDFFFYRNYLNMYVSSAVKGQNDGSAIGLAGAIGLNDFTAKSEVILGRNTKIETINPTEDNAISINASTDIENIGAAGHLIPSTSATSFGGTYFSQDFDSNSDIYVAEGSKFITNGKDAEFISNNKLKLTSIGVSSAVAKGGVEGMISRQAGNGHAAVYFDDEAYLSARNALFRVTDDTDIFNLAGAVMVNSGVGAGVGVAITDYSKTNIVNIGDIDEIYQDRIDELSGIDPETTTPNSLENRSDGKVTVSAKVNAEAKSTGDTTTIGVAGGITKNDDSGDDGIVGRMTNKFDGKVQGVSNTINSLSSKFGNNVTNNINSKSNKNGSHANPSFSLSAAGSLALNFVKNTTKVDIKGATFELGALADSNLNAVAINSSEVKGFAGAAGIMFQTRTPGGPSAPSKTVGIAGAVGMNDIENITEANVENTVINQADKVKVFAVDGGQNIGMGLGLQIAVNSGTADGAYTMGSSVSVSSINNTVKSTFKDNTVNGTLGLKTDLNVAAYDRVKQITGGVSVTLGQQKGAIGAAVNVNNVTNELGALIEGGTYSNINDVKVSAMQALTQLNLGLTAGIIGGTPNTVAIMGAMIYNKVENKASARIKDASFSTNGTVKVNSRDYKNGDAALSDFEALLEPVSNDVDQFVSTDGEDYYKVDTSNDVDGTNDPIANQELEGSLIVTGALAGTVSDTAVGAAVVINDLKNDFISEIENSTITASELEANASVNSKLISIAAGIAVSLNNGAGCGSVVYNDIDNTINAGFLGSDITAEQTKAQALNGSNLNSIAGIVSVGAGKASVGMAAACNDITNNTNAYSYATKLTGADPSTSEVLIDATNNSKILNIAAALSVSGKVAVAGSISVNEITDNTLAKIDDSYTDKDDVEHTLPGMVISDLYRTKVSAEDNAKITALAGNVAGGGTCGLGGSFSHSKINGETGAYINDANLNSRRIEIYAYQNSIIHSWAEGVGGAGSVTVQGAVSNTDLDRQTTTKLNNSNINNDAVSVFLGTHSSGHASSLAVAANGAGSAAIGAGVAVNRISDEVSSEVTESNLTLGHLSAKSKSDQTIEAIGVAGSAGGSAGVSGSVGYNRIRTTNNAFISNNTNINAKNNVGVIAQTDDVLINYGGLLSIGGTAGVGAAFSGNTIEGDTTAYIEDSTVSALGLSGDITTSSEVADSAMNNAFIDDQTTNRDYKLVDKRQDKTRSGLIVDSSSTHTMKSFVANAAGAGTVAFAGTVGVNSIEGSTEAYIKDASLNNGANAGNVYVDASDYTNYSSFVGSVGGAGTVGIGAAVSTNKTDRETSATIKNINSGSKAKALSVNATGKQGISSVVAGLGVAGNVGIAGTVSTTNFDGETKSLIKNANISVDSAEVKSNQFERSKVNNSTAGVGTFAGIGGSVAVGTDKHTVSSTIEDSSIALNTNGIGDITVNADNYTNFHTVAEALGGGIAGVAGNVSVNNFENIVTAEVNSSSLGDSTNRAGQINIEAGNELDLTADLGSVSIGAVGAGCSVGVNSIDGKVRTQVDGSTMYAADDINISANENRTIDQRSFTVAAGGGAASLNVMWLSSGEVISESNDDGNQELHDAIDAAEEVNENTIDDDNDALTDDEQANMNGVGGSLTADEAGKSATTIGIGDLFSGNSSTIDSSTGDVNISAKEDTTTTMKGGNVAVGGAAAGASIATLKTNRNLGITIHDAEIIANTDIDIDAEVTGSSDLKMYQGSAAIFAAGTAAFGKVETTGNVVNTISDSDFTTNSGDIGIVSKDTSSSSAESFGLTAGIIAGGFLNTGIDNSGSTNVNLSNNQMNADNNILIEAIKDNEITANSVGGNVGLIGSGIGVHSYVDDTSDSAVTMTGNNSSLNAEEISLNAKNTPNITSKATSGALSFMYSAGVSVATADIESKATLNVSDGNEFNASKVNFTGKIDGDSNVEAEGVSGGLVGSFGYNKSKSSNNAEVSVLIGDNSYSNLTDLVILGENIVNQIADTYGLNIGGILASGNNKAELISDTKTKVILSGNTSIANDINSLDIKADSSSIHNIKANGDGGGLISVDGLSAYAINDIKSLTEAILSGKWNIAETTKLFASQYDKVKIEATSIKATLAGYSGTKAKNTIDSTTKTHFLDNASITSGGDIDFGAKNTIGCNNESGDPKYAAKGSGYGGVVVNGAKSIADITSNTEVKIGNNSTLYADGNISADAKTIAKVKNRVLTNGAGVVANPLATNDSEFDIENKIITSSGSNVKTKNALQDITLASSEQLDLKITADSDMQGGLGGVADADTIFSMDKTNLVEIFGDLYSTNDINLYADADSKGVKSKYYLDATAYAYNKHSAVAIANADVDSDTDQVNKVIIKSGSDLSAVRHIKLTATPGRERMTEESGEYTWASDSEKGGYSSSSSGQRSKNINSTNEVQIYGDLTAGIQNKVHITLQGIVDIEGEAENSSLEPTVTSTIQDYEDQLKLGSLDYGNTLFDRYQEVSDLEDEYAGTDAGIGYTAEKERLLNEMEKYGLYDAVNDIVTSGFTVQYVELPSMVSSGGNVVINTDAVKGNGTVKAQGSPEIIIDNHTNLYTKVNDLNIVDYGGEVIYNDVSLGDTASSKLSSLSYVETNDSANSLISVNQHWNGTVQVKDDDDVLQNLTPLSSIEINGNIDNPLGRVEVYSARGDIVIQGKTANDDASISGAEIALNASNGTIAQGFTKGIVNVGGTPEDIYKDYADDQEDDIDGHEGSTTTRRDHGNIDESEQSGTWIAGGSVYINASDINVNGLIQSGYAEYTISLAGDAQNKINDFNDSYNGRNITTDILTTEYKLNSGGAKIDNGVFKYEVQAFYNPQTKQIILEDVDPKGGKIYLTGRISSTGNGRIFAADGSADVNINNSTQNEIVLGKVNAGDLEGVIKITDTARDLITEFRRDSTTTYAIGSDNKNVSSIPGLFYSPKAGLYYNWSTGYAESTREEWKKTKKFYLWGGYSKNSSSIHDYENNSNRIGESNDGSDLLDGTYIGAVPGATGEYSIYYKNDVAYNKSWFKRWVTYDNWTHFSGYEKYKWGNKQGKVVTFQHSLNSSNNIGIGFIGSTTGGSINVNSGQNINLNNNITGTSNTQINLTSTAGSINQNAGRIVGDNVNFTAETGIGDSGQINHRSLNDNLNFLSATTSTGDVNIVSTASIGKQGDLFLNASTDDGNVNISNIGSIYNNGVNGKIKGDRIDLESKYGSIGQFGAALEIIAGQSPLTPGDTISASVNAKARNGIYLNQQAGDMRLGTIESELGDVNLKVDNGSFLNVLPANGDDAESKNDKLISQWIEMGLINADGSNNEAQVKALAINNFESGVRSEYENYKSQKETYDANPSMDKSSAFLDLETKYSAYANADAYLTAQNSDSSSDYYKIQNNQYGWSKDQLLYAIQNSIINPTSGSSQTVDRNSNITGKNITLTALNGGIGKDEATEEISLINIGSNIDNLKKIANSEASDVTWDDENNKATIKRTTPIGIQITDTDGSLTAIANNNIYIAGTTEDPIYVDNINSSGNNIRLLGKDGVFNVSTIPGTYNFSGQDLIIEGGNGSIGTTDKPMLTDVSGKFTARSEGLINIFQNSINALNVSAIYSGSDVTLRALNNLFSVNTGVQAEDLGYINSNGKLTLTSDGGSIGEIRKGLRFLADNLTSIEATAGNNLYMSGQVESSSGITLHLDKLTSLVAGTIEIISAGSDIMLEDTVIGNFVTLVGKSIIQNGANSQILTGELAITTANGATLDHGQNSILQAEITNTNSGDVILNTQTALVLKDVNNSATNGNVTINSDLGIVSLANSSISSLGDLTIIANNGLITLNNLSSGADIVLDTDGAVTYNNATTVGNFISETSNFITQLGTLIAGGDVTLTSQLNVTSNNFDVDGNLNISGQNIVINSAKAGKNIDLDATQTITSTTKLDAGINLNANANELITVRTVTAGNNLTLNSQQNAVTVASDITAANDIDIDGTFITMLGVTLGKNIDVFAQNGLATIYQLTATENFVCKAINGIVTALSIDANNISVIANDGAFISNIAEAANDIIVTAQTIGLVKGIAGNDIIIEALNGEGIFGSLSADNDIDLKINNGEGYVALIDAGRDLKVYDSGDKLFVGVGIAKRDLAISADSAALTAGLLTALNNLDVTAKSMEVLSAMAGEAGTITAQQGDMLLVNGISNKDLTISAINGKLTAGQLITANDLSVTAKELTIGNALASSYKSDFIDLSIAEDIIDMVLDPDFRIDIAALATMIQDGIAEAALPKTYDETLTKEILNGFTGGNSIDIIALDGEANVALGNVAGNLNISSANGQLVVGSLNAGKNINLTAQNSNITAGVLLALNNITANANSMKILNAMAGDALSLTAALGDIILVNGISNNDLDIQATNGNITAGHLLTGNNLNAKAHVLNIGNAIASKYKDDFLDFSITDSIIDTIFGANLNIDFTALASMIDDKIIEALVPEVLDEQLKEEVLNAFTGENTVNLTALNGDANIGIGYAAGDIIVSATNGSLVSPSLNAGHNLEVTANSISLINSLALENSNLTSNGEINITNSLTGNDLIVKSANGDIISINAVAGNDLSIISDSGDIDLTHAESVDGKTSIKTSAGSVLVRNDLTSGTTLDLEANQGIKVENIVSNDKATLKNTNGLIDIENVTTNNSDADIEISNTNGNAQLTTVNAGRNLIINVSNGKIDASNTTAGQSVSMSATNIMTQTINANKDISLTASENMNSHSLTANNNISILSTGNTITDIANAGTNLTITAGGNITSINSNSGNNSSMVSTGGNITITETNADNNVIFDAAGTTTIEKVETQNDLTINGADVIIAQAISGANMSVSADNEVTAQNLDAGVNLTITAGGDITSVNSSAGENVMMTSSKNIDTKTINAGNSVTLTATDNVVSESIIAGQDINLNAKNIESKFVKVGQDINMNGQAINSTKAEAARNIEFSATNNIVSEDVIAGNNIKLSATDNIKSNTSSSGNNTSFISSNGNIDITEANAKNDMSLDADGILTIAVVEAKNNISINSTDAIITQAISGANMNVAADNEVTAKNLNSGTNLTIAAGGNVNSVNSNAGHDSSMVSTGGNITITETNTDNNVIVDSAGTTTIEKVEAQNDLTINSADAIITQAVSGANMSVSADNEVTAQNLDAGANLTIAADGDIASVNSSAGENVMMTSSKNIDTKTINAGNSVTLTAFENIISESIVAGKDINLNAKNIESKLAKACQDINMNGQTINLTKAEATRNIEFSATNNIVSEDVIAGNNIKLTATDNIKSQSTSSGNNTSFISSNGNIDITEANAGADLTITAGGNITSINSNSGNDSSMVSTGGNIAITDANAANNMSLDAAGTTTIEKVEAQNDLTINSADAIITQAVSGANMSVSADNEVTAQNLDAGKNLTINSSGNINSVNSDADENVKMTSSKNIDTKIINAGNSVTLTAFENIISESIVAGKDINLNAKNIESKLAKAGLDINMNGQIINSTKAEAARNIEFAATNNIVSEDVIAGNNIKLSATDNIKSKTTSSGNNTSFISSNGNIDISKTNASNDISFDAAGAITIPTAEAQNNLSINGTKLVINKAKSGANMEIESGTSLNINGINAGLNMEVTVKGDINANELTVGNNILLSATENIISDKIIAGQDIDMSATNIDSGYANAGIDIEFNASNNIDSENLVSGNNTSFAATNNIVSKSIIAGRDINLNAKNIESKFAKAGLDINMNGQIINSTKAEAARNIEFSATNNIVIEDIIAGNNIKLEATGNIKSNTSSSGNDTSFISSNGNIDITEANADNDIIVDAAEMITIASVKANNNLRIKGTELTIDKATSGVNMKIKSGTDLDLDGIEAGEKIGIAVKGDFNCGNLTAGNNISLSATDNIFLNNINAGADINITAANINSKLAHAGMNLIFSATEKIISDSFTAGVDATLSAIGDIESKISITGNNSSFISSNGSLNIINPKSENSMSFEAAKTVNLVTVEAKNDLSIEASNVRIGKAKSGENFKIESGSSIELNDFATDGNLEVTVKNGDINAKNVIAKGNIDLETLFGDILSENGTIESENESINLIAQGKIDVHELLARKDISGLAKTDEIKLAKINGRKVTLIIKKAQKDITIDEANIEKSIEFTGDTVKINKINHTSDTGIINVGFTGIDNKALTEVEVKEISSNGGTHVNGLWATNAQIHSNTDYFYLKDVYLEEKGLLSNNNLTMSVYGKNLELDGSDIVVFFSPTGSHKFTDISFQNARSEGGLQTYVVFHASDDLPSVSKDMSNMDKISAETKSNEITLNSVGRQAFVSFERPYISNLISFSPANLISGQQPPLFNKGMSLQNNQIIYVSVENEESEN